MKFINETSARKLEDVELFAITGGDYGDTAKDTNPDSAFYSINKCVGKYVSPLHGIVSWGKIVNRRFTNGHWEYEFEHSVDVWGWIGTSWCTADDLTTNP